jgi:phosphatidylinositol-3-phosphatase
VKRLLTAILLAAVAMLLPTAAQAKLPPIRHVFIIVLENESASTTFAPNSPAPYLSKTLRAQGAFVPNYFGIGHESNDNYIAMISGQAPNLDNQTDCQIFSDFPLDTQSSYGQQVGLGCIYPTGVPTIVSQLPAKHLTWRDYNDGMGADPTRESAECGHPAIGSRDGTQSATKTDQYATRHNPFVYFHSIIDNTTLCDTHVVTLRPLQQDLASRHPPNYVFITPNLCNDGHDAKCANGGPGGLPAADTFLRRWVPRITHSSAFKHDGLLMILFDEADTSDSRACCGEIPGPGSPKPGLNGPGGGDTGAVFLSPFIKPGTVTHYAYNHYTMLRSVEDLFGLPHIGYAQLPGERSFGADIFTCPKGCLARRRRKR